MGYMKTLAALAFAGALAGIPGCREVKERTIYCLRDLTPNGLRTFCYDNTISPSISFSDYFFDGKNPDGKLDTYCVNGTNWQCTWILDPVAEHDYNFIEKGSKIVMRDSAEAHGLQVRFDALKLDVAKAKEAK